MRASSAKSVSALASNREERLQRSGIASSLRGLMNRYPISNRTARMKPQSRRDIMLFVRNARQDNTRYRKEECQRGRAMHRLDWRSVLLYADELRDAN